MGEYRVEILEILKRRAAPTRHPRRHPFRGVSPPLRRIRHPDRLKSDSTKLFLSGEIRRRVLSPFHEPSVEISYPPPLVDSSNGNVPRLFFTSRHYN